jgi:excisionase family DNA binding protein
MTSLPLGSDDASSSDLLVSAKELGRMTGVHEEWWARKARSGEVASYKLGRHVRFRLSDAEAYIAAQERSTA